MMMLSISQWIEGESIMHDSSSRWLWLQSGILVVCMAQILVSADGNVSIDSKNGILPEGTVRNQVGDAELEVLCRTTKSGDSISVKVKVTDIGVTQLSVMKHLLFLDVSQTQITNTSLVSIKDLPELRSLMLNETKVSNVGLASLSQMKSLRVLGLDHCRISDCGLKHIRNMELLEWLYLNDTNISDAGIDHLTALRRLKFLSVVNTRVTQEGIDRLHLAIPAVRIRY